MRVQPLISFDCHAPAAFRGRRRGAALVEFALVVGVLFVIVMGIIDFGLFARNSLTVSNAAREGARTAAIGRNVAQIRDRVKLVSQPLVIADSDIELTFSHAGGAYAPLGNSADGTQNQAVADDLVRVNVSVQNKSVTGAFAVLFNRTVRTAVTMRRERMVN